MEREGPFTWDERGHMVPLTEEHQKRWSEQIVPAPPPETPRYAVRSRRAHYEGPFINTAFHEGSSTLVAVVFAILMAIAGFIVANWLWFLSFAMFLFSAYKAFKQLRTRS